MSSRYDAFQQSFSDPLWHTKTNAGLDKIGDDIDDIQADITALQSLHDTEDVLLYINDTPTYSDNNTFTLPGNYTDKFPDGQIVHAYCGSDGMKYSTVNGAATYGGGVTTVNLHDTVLTSNLSDVYVVSALEGTQPTTGPLTRAEINVPGPVIGDIKLVDGILYLDQRAPGATGGVWFKFAGTTQFAFGQDIGLTEIALWSQGYNSGAGGDIWRVDGEGRCNIGWGTATPTGMMAQVNIKGATHDDSDYCLSLYASNSSGVMGTGNIGAFRNDGKVCFPVGQVPTHAYDFVVKGTMNYESQLYCPNGSAAAPSIRSSTYNTTGIVFNNGSTNRVGFSIAGSVKAEFTSGGLYTLGLDVNADLLRVRTAKTPATAGAAGNAGEICWDASYMYVCVATNTWKRAAIATW